MGKARSAGISGLAVALAAAGGLLLWTGIANRPVINALQDVLQGKPPGTSGSPTGPALSEVSTALDEGVKRGAFRQTPGKIAKRAASGDAIDVFVNTALAQKGKPYVWGAAGPNAFDCSGLVTFALKRAGLDDTRRVTAQYLVWDGAFTVDRNQCRRGDLVCWSGHIGIALGIDRMVHAPSAGRPVQESRIWGNPPPVIRRIKDQGEGE